MSILHKVKEAATQGKYEIKYKHLGAFMLLPAKSVNAIIAAAIFLSCLFACSVQKDSSPDPQTGDESGSRVSVEGSISSIYRYSSQAGFYDIEPVDFSFQQKGLRTLKLRSSRARMMYSFFPADSDPGEKPLFVIFSGGPGASTYSNIFAMNTAPYTLAYGYTDGKPFKTNPYSWSKLGNLLYIDAPNTGFSYEVSQYSGNILGRAAEFGAQNYNPFIDASQFIRVLLRFLNDHPGIQKNRVIIAGESYGGTRVPTMTNLILFYSKYGDGSRIYRDSSLAMEIRNHLEKTMPENSGKSFTPEMISKQFTGQILIEPQLAGRYQTEITGGMLEREDSMMFRIARETGRTYCPCISMGTLGKQVCNPYVNALIYAYAIAGRDVYDVTKPYDHSDILDKFASDGLTRMDVLSSVLGSDVEMIEALRPTAREDAYRYVHAGEISGGVDWDAVLDDTAINLLPPKAKAWLTIRKDSIMNDDGTAEVSLDKVLGPLKTWDEYFVSSNMAVYLAFYYNQATMLYGYDIDPESTVYGRMFLENLAYVKSMVTDAPNDLIIYSASIPSALGRYTDIVSNVEITGDADAGNRFIRVQYRSNALDSVPSPDFRTVYFPQYKESGHSVSLAQPAKLLDDIQMWMNYY
jgi:hypothetical protein